MEVEGEDSSNIRSIKVYQGGNELLMELGLFWHICLEVLL